MATPAGRSRAPYGSWPSPVTPELLVEQVVGLSDLQVDGDDLLWNEARPSEAGRQVVVRRRPDGVCEDVVPAGFSARTRVHEYGGSSYAARDGVVWFTNFADQRVWRIERDGEPEAVTPEAERYADFDVSREGGWIAAVRERHSDDGAGGEVVTNDVVVFPAAGGASRVVAEGRDFFAAPRWSPDGRSLCWLAWDHPDMPWDATELVVGPPAADGGEVRAGGDGVSVSQPRWAPDGGLLWVDDRSGWWNLYRDGSLVIGEGAEHTGPDWVFGQHTFDVDAGGRLVAVRWSQGTAGLVVVEGGAASPVQPDVDLTSFSSVRWLADGRVACIAAGPRTEAAVVVIDTASGAVKVVKRSRQLELDEGFVSVPRPVEFPTTGGRTAHALFYPPAHPTHEGPADERPPLLVLSHGGPTSAARPQLDLGVQFWTSRGIAVVDVNYGGSTGYGREYRDRLRGSWGVTDVDDCVAAAQHLAERGEVDGGRMVIKGGSAGGYTTLAALTFRSGVFAAGISRYGVADLEALARDTHKFESRYLDGLVGPWPEAEAVYRQRSPIHHTDRLSCPLLLLQGLEDRVVPPAQSEAMAEALRRKGIPFAYVTFEGEQHGFRQAATIRRAAEVELSFLGQVLGFEPHDPIEPVVLERPA